MKIKRKPTHPGEFFRDLLSKRGISVARASTMLGVSRKSLSSFVNSRSRLSSKMAKRLSIATGTSVEFWVNMQTKLDVWDAESLSLSVKVTKLTNKGE